MTEMATTTQSLALYRSNHRIQVDDSGDRTVCSVDGIRVHRTRGATYRHDTAEIAALIKESYGGIWPSKQSAIDAVTRAVAIDIAREDAFENGTLTFEWNGHAVDVDLSE